MLPIDRELDDQKVAWLQPSGDAVIVPVARQTPWGGPDAVDRPAAVLPRPLGVGKVGVVLDEIPEGAAGESDACTREDMSLAFYIGLIVLVETRGAD